MTEILYKLQRHKARLARVLLLLFMVSWVNLVIQAPVHAAMKSILDVPCHCKVGLCDSVLSAQDRADDGVATALPIMAVTSAVIRILPIVDYLSSDAQQLQRVQLVFKQTNPPPLSLSGILHI